jgi:glycosyltransferase involved in cell wall biosynthesis
VLPNRILIFHGYLLAGTGSNVYNARLAKALVGLGHEVHLFSQDRHPERQPFVDAVGTWGGGELEVRVLREPVRCTVYRPAIGGLLPVYVEDRYEGIAARAFARCSEAEIDAYLAANVKAVVEVCERVGPQLALANHLIMGPVVLARALAASGGTPYAVKVHGSALEYTVKADLERFLPFAREGLERAAAVLVGSRHTAQSLWAAMNDPTLQARTRLGPPGVDVEHFGPREAQAAAAGVRALARQLSAGPDVQAGAAEPARRPGAESDAPAGVAGQEPEQQSAFARDDAAAGRALARVDPERDRLVAFVGKLIVNKGVDLLLAAWPAVLARFPDARLVVVGFGEDRAWLERLLGTLASGDLERAQDGAGRHLRAFLGGLRGPAREQYLAAARALGERALFIGRLDHEELVELLPACEALVVPSTFPEAFGMVAAEAAACGALPVSAAHSGLAEVSAALAQRIPAQAAAWLSFVVDDGAVAALAARLVAWLGADLALRERTRAGLVAAVREQWSWQSVAERVVAAARGELDRLSAP